MRARKRRATLSLMSDPPPLLEVPSRTQLIEALGKHFLGYVCACDPRQVERAYTGAGSLPARQQAILDRTLGLAAPMAWLRPVSALSVESMGGSGPVVDHSFGQFCAIGDDGLTLAQRLRTDAGGDVVELPDPAEDLLRHALHWFARDMWPYLLVGRPLAGSVGAAPTSGAGAAAFNHPAQAQLRDALAKPREPVGRLFAGTDAELAESTRISTSGGTAGTVQLALLAQQLIENAAARCGWPRTHEWSGLISQVDSQLAELRSLVRGRVAAVPADVGLAGLTLGTGQELETALGTLRPAPMEIQPIPGPAQANLQVRLAFPLRYTLDVDVLHGPDTHYWESWRIFHGRINQLRLAVLLAVHPSTSGVLQVVAYQVRDPIFWAGRISPWRLAPPAIPIEAEEHAAIVEWARLLKERYHPSLAMAIRRVLLAADGLRDPEDALVDAVIGLESLFGTGQGEVAFRLQTALAFLFGTDASSRATIHAEVRELYDARSKLVHGGHLELAHELYAMVSRAVNLLLDSLRRLLTTHQHLLSDQARGKRLILAGGAVCEDSTE
jgi:hypothetical protein